MLLHAPGGLKSTAHFPRGRVAAGTGRAVMSTVFLTISSITEREESYVSISRRRSFKKPKLRLRHPGGGGHIGHQNSPI
jgi:hypothetical protein